MPENNGPQFDFRTNYLNYLNHKPTSLVPTMFVGFKEMGFGAINGPSIEKRGAVRRLHGRFRYPLGVSGNR